MDFSHCRELFWSVEISVLNTFLLAMNFSHIIMTAPLAQLSKAITKICVPASSDLLHQSAECMCKMLVIQIGVMHVM